MACMCGDLYCLSCGPAQGNYRCPQCGKWSGEGGCDQPEVCNAAENAFWDSMAAMYNGEMLPCEKMKFLAERKSLGE